MYITDGGGKVAGLPTYDDGKHKAVEGSHNALHRQGEVVQ